MEGQGAFHEGSSSEEEEPLPWTTRADNRSDSIEEKQDPHHMTVNLVLRVHAANLPRYGMRKLWPDTYVNVHLVCVASDSSAKEDGDNVYENSFSSIPRSDSIFGTRTDSKVVQKEEIGRTEIIYRNTHPQYITTFPISYVYGSKAYLSIDIYRLTCSANREPIRIGSTICEVGDVLGSKNRTKMKRLRSGGVIFCRLEMATEPQQAPSQQSYQNDRSIQQSFSQDSSYTNQGRFRFQIRACDLKFGKRHRTPRALLGMQPDTILQIQKRHPNATQQAWMTVYRSSPVYESTSPTFDQGEIDLGSLCNGNIDNPIRIGVWCHKKRSKDILVGICETTVQSILDGKRALRGHFCMDKDQRDDSVHHSFRLCRNMQKNKDVGRIDIMFAQLIESATQEPIDNLFDSITATNAARAENNQEKRHLHGIQEEDSCAFSAIAIPALMPPPISFQDLMKEYPFKLDLYVAIDFTSSNGDPRCPGTLHEQSYDHLNDYEETILAVAGAMIDHCNSVSVYGFGAKYGGTTRHIFECGGGVNVREDGVDAILRAYKSVFETDLIMSGPTVFDQVLQAAAVHARNLQSTHQRHYTVLLVITDGQAQDMEETKRKLQVYSSVPLSVIFVGLGRADFAGMYRLCETIGNTTGRPNVSFVEFRRHQHDPFFLGMAALQELPTQMRMYVEQSGN